MTKNPEAAVFIVHGLRHLKAALEAGAATGRAVVALSAEAASAYAGPPWFLEMIAEGRAAFPGVPLTGILDCADRAGDALTALQLGARNLVFTGHPDAAKRLRAIAKQVGAEILTRRPKGFDLLNLRSPGRAALAHCQRLPAPRRFAK